MKVSAILDKSASSYVGDKNLYRDVNAFRSLRFPFVENSIAIVSGDGQQ